jgi:DNA-binding transcriptional LysR family regulator
MQPDSLKIFCDVVAQRNVTRAADENGVSQSKASQVVQHLEEELGIKLLDRTKRPFNLTPEGDIFYNGCRKLVQQYYALVEEVKTLHSEVSGRVSVASIYSVGLSHMNRIVTEFLQQYPKANVRLQYQHPHRVYEMVENDQVDIGLVSYPRNTRNIKATGWREERMVLVCAPQHPLAQFTDVKLEDLSVHNFIGFDSNLEIRHEIDKCFAHHNVEIRVAMEFDNTETIKGAVGSNLGIALLPEPTVTNEQAAGTLVVKSLVNAKLFRPIGIIQRRGKILGKTAKLFMELLQSGEQFKSSGAA